MDLTPRSELTYFLPDGSPSRCHSRNQTQMLRSESICDSPQKVTVPTVQVQQERKTAVSTVRRKNKKLEEQTPFEML